jgi:phosphoenolpyruvate synthase/pyruvate phosphate dikinase
MVDMKTIASLHDLHPADPALWGRKAATLARLARTGEFVIPAGIVLSGDGAQFTGEELDLAERSIHDVLGDVDLAVRSSSSDEDGIEASFAGKYATVLGVRGKDALAAAVRDVLASAGEAPMGVLIQELVRADAAGVAFSVNPVSGDRDQVIVDALPGLGDRLVSGELTPESWTVKSDGVAYTKDDGEVITAEVAKRIADLAREVERVEGVPQDIEWAIAGGQLYLLQARPVTTLVEPVPVPVIVPHGYWERESTHAPEPVTPMTASVLDASAGARHMAERFGLIAQFDFREIGGWIYMSMLPLGMEPRSDKVPPLPGWALALLLRLIPEGRRRIRAARQQREEDLSMQIVDEWNNHHVQRLRVRIQALRDVDLGALTDGQLAAHLASTREFLAESVPLHFLTSMPHFLETTRLEFFCEEHLGWDFPQVLNLVAGTSAMSSEPARELRRLADRRLDPAGKELALEEYRRIYGARALSTEIAEPTFGECPGLIAAQLEALATGSNEDPSQEQQRLREEAAAQARKQLRGEALDTFNALLDRALRAYPLREHNVFYAFDSPLALFRYSVLEAGRRMQRAESITSVDDVFYCTADEVQKWLEGQHGDLRAHVQRRRGERAWILAHPGPGGYGTPPPPPPNTRWLPADVREMMKLMMRVGQRLVAPEGSSQEQTADEGILRGTPASPGTYIGAARIVANEREFARIRPGDVLVCPTTRSSWSTVFASIGAVVTDAGGALSHPAIIAREHRIPAVVATGNATKVIRDGAIVMVDGSNGTVNLTTP